MAKTIQVHDLAELRAAVGPAIGNATDAELICAAARAQGESPAATAKNLRYTAEISCGTAEQASSGGPFIAAGLELVTLIFLALFVDRRYGQHPRAFQWGLYGLGLSVLVSVHWFLRHTLDEAVARTAILSFLLFVLGCTAGWSWGRLRRLAARG